MKKGVYKYLILALISCEGMATSFPDEPLEEEMAHTRLVTSDHNVDLIESSFKRYASMSSEEKTHFCEKLKKELASGALEPDALRINLSTHNGDEMVTPLFYATVMAKDDPIANGWWQVISLLIRSGANPNYTDNRGRTPMSVCSDGTREWLMTRGNSMTRTASSGTGFDDMMPSSPHLRRGSDRGKGYVTPANVSGPTSPEGLSPAVTHAKQVVRLAGPSIAEDTVTPPHAAGVGIGSGQQRDTRAEAAGIGIGSGQQEDAEIGIGS